MAMAMSMALSTWEIEFNTSIQVLKGLQIQTLDSCSRCWSFGRWRIHTTRSSESKSKITQWRWSKTPVMEHNQFKQQKTEKPIAIAEGPPIRENWTLRIVIKPLWETKRHTDTKPESKELSDSAPANPNSSHSRWDGLESLFAQQL